MEAFTCFLSASPSSSLAAEAARRTTKARGFHPPVRVGEKVARPPRGADTVQDLDAEALAEPPVKLGGQGFRGRDAQTEAGQVWALVLREPGHLAVERGHAGGDGHRG